MSKIGWAGVVVISVLITGSASFYLYTQKDRLFAVVPAEMPAPPPPAVSEVESAPAEPAPAPEKAPEAPVVRNILFRLSKPAAKSVSIVGDFNQWKRQKLAKKDKVWEISLELKPGTYQYQYVIDDRRVKDPNNKTVQNGKSVIVVKPLAPQ